MTNGHDRAAARISAMLNRLEGRDLRDDAVLAEFLATAGFAVADAQGAPMAVYALDKLAETIDAVSAPAVRELAEAQPAGRA